MKSLVLSCALVGTLFTANKLQAQCTVSEPVVGNIQKVGCTFTFDLSFNLSGNGGNKVTAIYIYNTADYTALPSTFYGQNGNHVPSSAELNAAKALAVIKINTDSTKTVYNYQKVSGGYERPTSMKSNLDYTVSPSGQVTIQDIQLSFPTCNSQITLNADVLSSQSPDLSSVGCIAKGLSFSPNEPIIRVANIGCGGTRQIATTFITAQSRDIRFQFFKDVAPFGQFTSADTASANAVSDPYYTTTQLNSNGEYSSVGNYNYTVNNGEQFNVWVVAYADGVPNISADIATNSCIPLAATFRSFSAVRSNQNVLVKWETVLEENNRGFYVQRQSGSGEWQNVAFVATQAPNGSSASLLTYSFTDFNTTKGISQYRIQQVSLDGKSSYSVIRSVRSEEMASKVVVYPNPTSTGKVTLAFESASEKDVIVNDMTGRMVKRFTSIKDNSLVIENLKEGFYTIQILEKATSSVSIEKVVVKQQ